jgi:hypothetical protein
MAPALEETNVRIAISDLHMNAKTGANEFDGKGYDGTRRMMVFLEKLPDKSLVLNGDIVDLWSG